MSNYKSIKFRFMSRILKKTIAAAMSILLVVSAVSCKKESLGLFMPQKKIDKIYVKSNSGNVLRQEWSWNNGLLMKIDHYMSNGKVIDYTEEFTYNGSRIVSVSARDERLDYYYEGEKLSRIEYSLKNAYKETYELVYGKSAVDKILITVEESGSKPDKRLLAPLWDDGLNACIADIAAKTDSKGVQRGEIRLRWDGGNVVRADMVRNTGSTASSDPTITFNYTYDKQKNPFGNLLSFNIDNMFDRTAVNGGFGANNIMSAYRTVFNDDLNSYQTESWIYEYEYKSKYPVSVKEVHTDHRGRSSKGEELVISYH